MYLPISTLAAPDFTGFNFCGLLPMTLVGYDATQLAILYIHVPVDHILLLFAGMISSCANRWTGPAHPAV